MADPYFQTGAEVEIASSDPLKRGIVFQGTIIGPSMEKNKFIVEYDTLFDSGTGLEPLRQEVRVGLLRPLPPLDYDYDFKLGDAVDAFFKGGWREGTISKVLKKSRYVVYFRFGNRDGKFAKSELRHHREWVKGSWVPPFQDEGSITGEGNSSRPMMKGKFEKGSLVEVSLDEDGFEGAWHAATIIKAVRKGKFLVECQNLGTDDETALLTEEIDEKNIRPPYPSEFHMVDGFNLHDEVEALYNDAWWEGVICKVLHNSRYKVYFKATNDEMVFEHSKLRPRQDWNDDTWVMASQCRKKKRRVC